MQSPGAGQARTSRGSCTPGPAPGLGSVEALVKGRARERCAPGTLGSADPGSRPSPCTRRAGAGVRLGAQVRGGPMEGENRPAPRTPGKRARRRERRARAGEREATALEKEDGGALAARRTHLGSGRPLRVRASCRSLDPSSCPSPCLCLLCARTSRLRSARSARTAPGEDDARQVWSEGLGKVCPSRGRETGLRRSRGAGASPVACWERLARGVRSRPPGTSGRSVRRSPLLSGLLLSPKEVLGSRRAGSRRCRLLSCSPSSALAARGGRDVHCPARALITQAATATLRLTAFRASPEFPQVLGNSSSALFQLPQNHPPPACRLEAGASFSPSPCLAPSLFPTTPPPRGADTPPGGAWARRSRRSPFHSRARPGRRAGGGGARSGRREPPTGVAGTCVETPQPPLQREPNREAREIERPRKRPRGLRSWLSSLCLATRQRPEGLVCFL